MIITILRKPLEGTVADNALKHGCGAINIDDTRIGTSENLNGGAYAENPTDRHDGKENWRFERGKGEYKQPSGRWPANFILTHLEDCVLQGDNWVCIEGCPVQELDKQSGVSKSTGGRLANISNTSTIYGGGRGLGQNLDPKSVKGDPGFGDEGGASRFFKQFKKDNKDMVEYFKTMMTPPVDDALVLVAKPSEIDYGSCLDNGEGVIPNSTPKVHGAILLEEPTEEEAQKLYPILKPGAHIILIPQDIGYKGVIALEDTGFEVRDAVFVGNGNKDFHYCAKASRSEREAGTTAEDGKRGNIHPTVKPIKIMEWCARDIAPNSKVVDPFLGSGTTGIAMSRLGHHFVGIELNPEYTEIAEARIVYWSDEDSKILFSFTPTKALLDKS